MTRTPKSDGDLSADLPTRDDESWATLLSQCEALDAFDETVRVRFGRMISAAVVRAAKRR